nr:hypothetical protein [uncultured Paenibacillus sp.]
MNDLKYSAGLKIRNACDNLWISEYGQFFFPGRRPSGQPADIIVYIAWVT